MPYYLDEDHDWDLNVKELDRAFAEAQSKGIRVRALCVINPGNPTGNHLSEHSLIDVLFFVIRWKILTQCLDCQILQTKENRIACR